MMMMMMMSHFFPLDRIIIHDIKKTLMDYQDHVTHTKLITDEGMSYP